jgi:hypothetical protein
VGDAHAISMAQKTPFDRGQMLPSTTTFKASNHPFSVGKSCVYNGVMVRFQWIFFFSLLSLSSPRISCNPFQKLNVTCQFVSVSILIFILLTATCFAFHILFEVYFFLISPLNILFYLIFVSNLVIILLVTIFFYPFLYFFFNFIPQHFISFNFFYPIWLLFFLLVFFYIIFLIYFIFNLFPHYFLSCSFILHLVLIVLIANCFVFLI